MPEDSTREQKYFDVKNKQLETIEQPVYMTDIIMGYNIYPLLAPSQNLDSLIRQLKLLIDITRHVHNELYADPKDHCKMRPGFENHVTRFISNEFSFHGNQPITLSNFTLLINDLKDYLKPCNKNIIFFFSTFNIIDKDQKVYTTTLIIQGDQEPLIHALSKINPLSAEIPRRANFSSYRETFKRDSNNRPVEIKSFNYEEEFITGTPLLLSSDSHSASWNFENVFRHTLSGGAEYCFLIDTCFDHLFKAAKYNYINMIDSAINNKETLFIPSQVSQILTSNTMDIATDSKVTNYATHADPLLFYKYKYQPQLEHLDTLKANHSLAAFPEKLSSKKIIDFFTSKKATASYEETSRLFEVKYSDFTFPFRLAIHECYTLQRPHDEILEKIQAHNLTILRGYSNLHEENQRTYEANKKSFFLITDFVNQYLDWLSTQAKNNSLYYTTVHKVRILLNTFIAQIKNPNFHQRSIIFIKDFSTQVADISKKYGKTPLDLAKEHSHNEIAELLNQVSNASNKYYPKKNSDFFHQSSNNNTPIQEKPFQNNTPSKENSEISMAKTRS